MPISKAGETELMTRIQDLLVVALTACVSLSASSALASITDTTRAGAPAPVTVPFAPTLGKPLHVHEVVSETRYRNKIEQPASVTTSDEDLIFETHNAAGYVLRWTTRSVNVHTSPERQAMMEAAEAAGVGKPVVIQTNPHGAPVALINGTEVRALFSSAFEAMAASVDTKFAGKPQEERDARRKAFTAATASYRNMTDDQLSAAVLKEPRTLFGLGGMTLTPGLPTTRQGMFRLPLVNADVTGVTTVELRGVGHGEITIAVSTSPDPTEMKSALAAFLKNLVAGAPPDQRAKARASFDNLPDLKVTNELVVTLDMTSGLPRQANHRTAVDFGGVSQTRTETYSVSD